VTEIPNDSKSLDIKGFITITTWIIKSLLTSLFQREELPLFEKEGWGEILPKMSVLF